MIEFGLLNEELGRGCSSIRSLLTVAQHGGPRPDVWRWGTEAQKAQWAGKAEPRGGNRRICSLPEARKPAATHAASQPRPWPAAMISCLPGIRDWITFGQIASLFLVFAQSERGACAFLVEPNAPGFHISPVHGMLGTRASMMAEIHLEAVPYTETEFDWRSWICPFSTLPPQLWIAAVTAWPGDALALPRHVWRLACSTPASASSLAPACWITNLSSA